MRKKDFKKEKFQEKILMELNTFLRQNLSDHRLQFVSFTKAELNFDFSRATLFWDSFDVSLKESQEKSLHSCLGKLRSLLARHLEVRHVPQLELVYDAQYVEEEKITNLLNESQIELVQNLKHI